MFVASLGLNSTAVFSFTFLNSLIPRIQRNEKAFSIAPSLLIDACNAEHCQRSSS